MLGGRGGAGSGTVLHHGDPEEETRRKGSEPCEWAQSIAAPARPAEGAAPDCEEEEPGDEADHRCPHAASLGQCSARRSWTRSSKPPMRQPSIHTCGKDRLPSGSSHMS